MTNIGVSSLEGCLLYTSIDFGTQEYVWQALRYIESNYMNPIRIEDLATHVGLSRKYFYPVSYTHLNS